LAAISQYEAELVATRTKQALAAKKAQGYTLGNPEHLMDKLDEAVAKSVETNKRKAEENPNNKRAAAMLKVLAKEGKTLQEMADYLNEQGFTTSRGFKFTRSSVHVLLKRNNIERT